MQNDNYQTKHRRGSSPHQEITQGYVDWVRGLPSTPLTGSIKQTREYSQRGDRKKELTVRESGPRQTGGGLAARQSDDEGHWQDDGGESG